MTHLVVTTPFGPLTAFDDGGAIVALTWGAAPDGAASPLLSAAADRLSAYFAGRLRSFALPLRPAGTPFQRRVWRAMQAIPYGETTTYGALAAATGSAPRAVGQACAANPIAVIIPCHRVVGAGGRMTGYSGGDGVATKASLLDLERRFAGAVRPVSAPPSQERIFP